MDYYINWIVLFAMGAVVLLLFESAKVLGNIRLAVQLIHDTLNSGPMNEQLGAMASEVQSVGSQLHELANDVSDIRERVKLRMLTAVEEEHARYG